MTFTIQPTYIHHAPIASAAAILAINSSPLNAAVAAIYATYAALSTREQKSGMQEAVHKFTNYYKENFSTLNKDEQSRLLSLTISISSVVYHTLFLYAGTLAASYALSITPFTFLGALGTSAATLAATAVFDFIFPESAPPPIKIDLSNTRPTESEALVPTSPRSNSSLCELTA